MVHVPLRQHDTGYCTVGTLLVTLVVQKYPLGTKHVRASLINTTILSTSLIGVYKNVFTVNKVVLLRIHTSFLNKKRNNSFHLVMNTFLGMENKILRIYSRDHSIPDRSSFEQRNNHLQVYHAKYAVSPI